MWDESFCAVSKFNTFLCVPRALWMINKWNGSDSLPPGCGVDWVSGTFQVYDPVKPHSLCRWQFPHLYIEEEGSIMEKAVLSSCIRTIQESYGM